jgi:two-component system response regulator PilR (NtrC family)
MQAVHRAVESAARFNSTVLITGETGTGKELIARAVHQNSTRRTRPFIAVNCNALTETILERELFGHVKGSFTGAHTNAPGFVRAAEGGTLLLDEIADLPLTLQGKLLRVLQERTVIPVGAHKEIHVDVRFIAATNKDCEREVHEGRFRHDLYQRLKVVEIHAPPLRARLGDVAALVDHFLSKLSAEMHLEAPIEITEAARAALSEHTWPGNVRELENTVERLIVENSGHGFVTEEAVHRAVNPPPVAAATKQVKQASVQLPGEACEWFYESESPGQFTRRVRREAVNALVRHTGTAVEAARCLGMTPKLFNQLLHRAQDEARDTSDATLDSYNPEPDAQKDILFVLPAPIYGYPEGEDLGAFVCGIVEKVITTAIKQTGSKAAAARALGTDPSSLRSRLEHAQRVLTQRESDARPTAQLKDEALVM